jgi:hypothetical protein
MAAGTLFLGAPQIGYIAGNEVIGLGLGLVAFCFPLHLLAATLAFLGRDAVAGLASAILAGVWLVAGIEMLKAGRATREADWASSTRWRPCWCWCRPWGSRSASSCPPS